MVIRVERYKSEYKNQWNEFLLTTKNYHFFFHRDYMEYHADRFTDFSLLFFAEDGSLLALLPASISGSECISHAGLSFGGFLVNSNMKANLMLEIFTVTKDFLKANSVSKFIYKAMPYIYHSLPAEEDLYALFINNAKLIRRDLSSTIDLTNKIQFQERRRRSIKKAQKAGLIVEQSKDFKAYWQILESVLEKYSKKPVHSLEEIELLATKFPENIKLFVAKDPNTSEILGGTVIYENPIIAHAQYLANSSLGQEMGALDLVIDQLVNNIYNNKNWFDFGISTTDQGLNLNAGLVEQKEGFGARATVNDFYEVAI